ncbi:MAG TPA: hypothetical protein ENJ18_16990 [Nannocystis exedens]|nr:hypothetical protein [Nannocystis exedens]
MLHSYFRDFSDFLDLYVDQDSDGLLVVSCEDMASGLVAAAIDSFDERHKLDAGISITAPIDDINTYILALVRDTRRSLCFPEQAQQTQETQQKGGAAANTRAESDATTSEVPAAANGPDTTDTTDTTQSPAEQLLTLLRELIEHLDNDARLLFALTPAQIDDHQGYREFVSELLQNPLPRLRLVLRDERPAAHIPEDFTDTFRTHPGVHLFDLPVDFQTLVQTAEAAANDPARPRIERLSALLQLGFYQLGQGANDGAEVHFCQALAELSQAPKSERIDPSMLSLAIFGRGEALRLGGAFAKATETLMLAWQSAESSPPAVKVSIAFSLGRSLAAEHKFCRAQVFLSLATAFAARCDATELAGIILLELGDVETALGDHEAAREAWRTAREHTVSDSSEFARDLDRRLQASLRA